MSKVHEFRITTGQVQLVCSNISAENVVIQSIWFKSTSTDPQVHSGIPFQNHFWANPISHNGIYDNTKYTVRIEGDRLYFYCSKLYPNFNGECKIIFQILQVIYKIEKNTHCD